MPAAVADILARIVAHKREELAGSERRRMASALEKRVAMCRSMRQDFRTALTADVPAVIAELKEASPSRGPLIDEYRPGDIAREYRAGGAAALSVLTDLRFFKGTLSDLWEAKHATGLPALRKDFLLDEFQLLEAAAYGADAVLLIAAILSDAELRDLRERARDYGLDALVEVHDEDELARALDAGAELIGVNNRDLRTFQVDLNTSVRLAARMPAGVVRVAESGIDSPEAIRHLMDAGYQAFLVGEHLMRAEDRSAALHHLRSVPA